MYTQETVLRLTALIYDAAIDPSLWECFLEELAVELSGHFVNFIGLDTRELRPSIKAAVRFDPEAEREYAAYYGQHDPWKKAAATHGLWRPGVVGIGEAILPRREYTKTEFWNDFGRRYDVTGGLSAVAAADGSSFTVLSASSYPDRSPFGEPERALIETLLPHISRSMQIHRRLTRVEGESGDLASVLDRASDAVLLLNRAARITFVNRAADQLARARDGLVIEDGELRASGASDTARLRRLLSDAAATAAGQGLGAGGVLKVRRPSGRRPLVAVVSPLPARHTFLAAVEASVVAVMVTDPERVHVPDEDTLRALLGLTRAEAKLARLLAAGGSVEEAAERLGLRTATVRTRLKEIFEKTSTHRQSELVRLILNMTPRL